MLHRSFKPAKCKTSLKLATSRMKLLRNKKDAQLKQLKREVSQLLESGKERTARIRVEHVTREENTIAAYDLLEIYCELIVARLPIIESQKNCPLDLKEAIASLIFASPRCADIPEFVDVKKHFTAKYGKEFITAATELRPDCGVSRMLIEKLSVKAPDGQAKMKILSAIAAEFNIKWDPELSGENESKPPDDLMNGPTTFTKASEVHRSSAVQSPPSNVQPPSSGVRKQHAPVDINHIMSPTYAKNDSFTSSGDQTTKAGSSGPDFLPSGTGSRKDVRHSHSGDRKDSSMGRQNWHMEFEDATAAAEAAAESAQRASMAARAAAEIASREKITKRQYSRERRRSNIHSFRDEGSRENDESRLPTSDSPKTYNSGSRSSHIHTEQRDNPDNVAHTFYRDGHDSTQRSNRSDSLRSKTASVSDNYFQGLETSVDNELITEDKKGFFSGKSTRQHSNGSSVEFVIDQQPHPQYEETDYGGEERIRKQPSNVFSDSLPRDQGNDHDVPHSSFQKFGADSFENPFVSDDQGFTKNSNDNAAVVFDESGSDEDIISFDTQPDHDIKPSKFYSPSHGRESSSHASISTDTWSPRKSVTSSRQEPMSAFDYTTEKISPHKFDENATRSPHPSEPDDVFSPTFDDSESCNSASEDELDKENPRHSRRYSGFSPFDDLKDEESRKPSSRDTLKDEMSYHESKLDSEFNFGTLSGGLRNKGYRHVPYARSSPTALSSSTENKTDNNDDSGVASSFKPGGASPRVNDKWNPVTLVAPNESDTDDSEEELPHSSHGKQKFHNAKESKEVHARSRIKAPAPDTFLDPNEGESENNIPRLSPSGPGRAGSGLSRRTKGASSPRMASYSSSPGLKSPVSYEADPGKKGSKSHYESNTLPKRESASVSLNWQKSADWRASKQTTSTQLPDSNGSSRTEYLKSSSTMERPSRPLKKVPLASYESPKASVAAQEGPSRESSASKSSLMKKVPSTSAGSPKSSISHAEAPSRESSFGKASHVHPKLPDYDTIAALLQSRRTN